MSNSPLVTYINLTKNHSGKRNHVIDTITIHCYVAQVTAKQGCDYFASTDREASSNYVVGKDGSIGLSVEECNRSWCSSSRENDHRAVTIEVASDTKHPYAVTNAAYEALIKLCADICKRNGIKQLLWKGDKSLIGQVDKQNMTVHRWFENKACPGDYLYNRHGDIAERVNKLLGANTPEPEKPASVVLHRVQTGAFSKRENADAMLAKVKAAGFDTYMIQVDGLYKIQVGAFENRANAVAIENKLKAAGFDTFITTKSGTAVSNAPAKKSVDEIAREVILGKWGNGQDRFNKLKAEGYDPDAVQDRVNELLK